MKLIALPVATVATPRCQRRGSVRLPGRTGIVIAPRLETLDVCDDIAVLDRGRVVEHGPREVLAANPDSRYARVRMIGESAEELA